MKLKHLFYAAAVSTLAAACSEADELSSGILSEKTLMPSIRARTVLPHVSI